MQNFSEITYAEFTKALASNAPVPGGGGASALAGALGVALCSMAGNLTIGRKKYADVEADIRLMLEKGEALQTRLLSLIDEDAKAFEPLAAAYSIPKDYLNREEVMEKALSDACSAPIAMMECCCQAADLLAEMLDKGNVTLVSDVGVGALLCGAALKGASLNIFINTKSMIDREEAEKINNHAGGMLAVYIERTEGIYQEVARRLR